jgi:DNA-binding NtrC family response regulator
MRVLLIDDDPTTRKFFNEILKRNRFIVSTAKNGREARALTQSSQFDVIIYDLKLPDVQGITLINELPGTDSALKIVITGFPSFEHTIDAIHRGANYFLTKPVNPNDILRIINQHFHNRT